MSWALLTLESFQALTAMMLSAAEAQEWEELARFSEERTALATTLPSDLAAKLPPSELAQGRIILELCQQLDIQIRLLVEERQKALRILLRIPNPVT